MLCKTNGIVLRVTAYGETSGIVKIFTKDFGLQSYMINGMRSKTAKNKAAVYQPLNLLDMVVYHKENTTLSRIKEACCTYIYSDIWMDIKKSSIMLFLNEVLNRVIKDQSHTGELYDFMRLSLATLDTLKHNVENFHLIFLIKLAQFLGSGISRVDEVGPGLRLASYEEKKIQHLLNANYDSSVRISHKERQRTLEAILHFYSCHIHPVNALKSIPVLHEILHHKETSPPERNHSDAVCHNEDTSSRPPRNQSS